MLETFKIYWNYFKYVMEHKKNVFRTCWARGLYGHAFTHDLSKFNPKEFFPYAEWFYRPNGIKLKENYSKEQLTNGMSCLSKNYLDYKVNFDKAWQHHYKNNPHHWNYWIDESGEPQSMEFKYLKQMIADWEGMSLKFGDTAQQYYLNNYKKINLEYNTRLMLEMMLNLNDSLAHGYGHTLEDFANKYDKESYNAYFGFIKDKYGIDTYKLLKSLS